MNLRFKEAIDLLNNVLSGFDLEQIWVLYTLCDLPHLQKFDEWVDLVERVIFYCLHFFLLLLCLYVLTLEVVGH